MTLEVRNPYDGSVVGTAPAHTAADVDEAVRRAADALAAGPLAPWRRAEVLDTAARLLAERVEDFARTIAAEAAKPLKTARIEAQRAVSTFTFAAVAARTLTGDMVPIDASEAGEGKLAFTLRVPVGVVGGITPFNFPLNLVAHKVAPAVAAGSPLVVKPASSTPLSALKLRALLVEECGLPEAWLQVLPGPAGEVGRALVEHDDVAMITFTGSGEVGWGLKAQAPRKKVNLELGNNSPVIVDADGDWEAAARKIAVAGFSHAGQSCVSTQRVYVHESVVERFLSTLVPLVEQLVVGDPLDERTDVSSLITTDDRDRVRQWVEEAVAGGAELLCGGKIDGTLLWPTVLANVRPEMRVCREEVFGPVVAVQSYADFDEALRLADDTKFGLQAGVFTRDVGKALGAARTLRFGSVFVNEVPTWRADQMPYGGTRASGNTKEGPAYAVREMTEERLVVISA